MSKHSNQTVYLGCRNTQAQVTFWDGQIVRVTHIPKDTTRFPPDRPWVKDVLTSTTPNQESPDSWQIICEDGKVKIFNEMEKVQFSEFEPVYISDKGKYRLSIQTSPDEKVYGWGEWFNKFTREKSRFTLINRESPAPLQSRQTYSNLPILYSSQGYYFFLLNSHATTWDVDPRKGVLSVSAPEGFPDYFLFFGKDPKTALQALTRLLGRPPLLPRWVFGLWVTSFPQENQEKTLDLVHEHRKKGIPLDSVILDYHWEEKFHNFHWRKSLFPNSSRFIHQLNNLGIKLGLIFTPFVNRKINLPKKLFMSLYNQSISKGTLQEDELDLNGYTQGLKCNYFAHPNAPWWFGKGGMVDFTNPLANQWWNQKLNPLYRQGVSFFKNDDGEYLPNDATSHLGISASEYHNLYGFYYGKAIYEGMQELDDRRAMIYARSVWAGSQRYPGMFLGDQIPNFENIKRSIHAGLNMSLLGFTYWTADCFGLNGKTTPEMHMRYAQWGLMVPIARYFVRPRETDSTRFPWSHNEQVEQNFRRHVELRYRLLPYFQTLGWEAYLTGVPIIRPLFVEFPDDPETYQVDDQMMLGESAMLAPVLMKKARSRIIYFPKGLWFDYWTGRAYEGGQYLQIDTLPDFLPLFVRGGAILPMSKALDFIPRNHHFDHLELHFWPHYQGKFNFRDDDGTTTQYQSGKYSELEIETACNIKKQEIVCTFTKSKVCPPFGPKSLDLIFHNISQPEWIKVNDHIQKIYEYDRLNKELKLSIPLNLISHQVLIKGTFS